jgi:GH15 family glucan-1,4-alpha-glucosidase
LGESATGKPFYGLLSNAYTAALVSPAGSIDWWPLPRFDGDSVFSRLLDEEQGGACALRPLAGGNARQRYLDGTNVLITEWDTAEGRATVTDLLAIGRPELRRSVRSEVAMELTCTPRFHMGRTLPAVVPLADGATFRNPAGEDALQLRVLGQAVPLGLSRWQLPPGRHEIVLRYVRHADAEPGLGADGDALRPGVAERRVARFWRALAGPRCTGPYAAAVERSLLVIRGLTFRTTGGPVAAATTSLPEVPGEGRQWDYRFVWIRDGSYAAEALLLAGDLVAVRRFLEFLFNSVDLVGKPFPCPFLRVDGTLDPGERECLWLAGHRGSRPVRVGNSATWQNQLDIEGDFLWLVWRYVQTAGDLALLREFWWAIEAICTWVARNHRRADASLWEFRQRPARYTHSALMCWVALACGARLAAMAGRTAQAGRWQATAEAIADEIRRSARGHFRQRLHGGDVDAALLCLPLYGLVRADDALWQRTLAAVEERLCRDDLVWRYRADPMGPARYPFVMASFWLARAHLRGGNVARAQALIDRALACATDLGLWGEHYDPEADEPRGNFPQLFPHAGLVTAAHELAAALAGESLPGSELGPAA